MKVNPSDFINPGEYFFRAKEDIEQDQSLKAKSHLINIEILK